ncbi:hypothetical protein B9Z19DRAFT_1013991 [Tuber borchii]|uniref:Uncharacterized protein n=1 Tax=Tuber borchii TaxID=42251 RepID=A0A2T7A9K4_TUBBO|nr:hypothetical protein B9Z19DRAFT_1013991 [Tuber borchii]
MSTPVPDSIPSLSIPTSSITTTAATSISELSLNDTYTPRYIDVGINLTSSVFRGSDNGKQYHEDDLEDVLQRAKDAGCQKLMVTGSCYDESKNGYELAQQHPGLIYSTVGVHPCSVKLIDSHPSGPEAYLSSLRTLAQEGASSGYVTAFGEIGLDYDRLYHASKEDQKKYFALQLDLAEEIGLPLFLHSRAAAADFEDMLFPRLPRLSGGLVHSFTGTVDEMRRLVGAGLYVSVNGCSLKTEENLEVVRQIPLERLMLETDGPWCEIRPSHASYKHLNKDECPPVPKQVRRDKFKKGFMVKGRNEPCNIPHVAYIVAAVKGVPLKEVCEAAWKNTLDLFGMGKTT